MTFTYFGLFLSLTTVFDLYMVLRNPFANSEKRVKKLIFINFLTALFLGSLSLSLTKSKKDWVAQLNYWMLLSTFILAFAFAVFMMIIIMMRLNRKGMNKLIKKSIQRRYLEFVLLLTFCAWWMNLVMKPSYRYEKDADPPQFQGKTKYSDHWYEIVTLLFGFLMALSRLRDQVLRTKLYNMYMWMTCRKSKAVQLDKFDKIVEQNALNTFLTTSLNTELVITILKGILILAASSSDKIDHMADEDMYQIKQTATIELQKIKIKDASQFNMNEHGEINRNNNANDESRLRDSSPSPLNARILDTLTSDEESEIDMEDGEERADRKNSLVQRNTMKRTLSDQFGNLAQKGTNFKNKVQGLFRRTNTQEISIGNNQSVMADSGQS